MKNNFVHLRTYSDFSVLRGMCSIEGLKEECEKEMMSAVAITDFDYMGGAVNFYKSFLSSKTKAIIGTEFTVTSENDLKKKKRTKHNLVLLAKNKKGYKNLCKLHSVGAEESPFNNLSLRYELLEKYSDGLICLTAGLKGEISTLILEDDIDKAKTILQKYIDIFGKDNLYLEMTNHYLKEEEIVNKALLLLSKEFDIPVVATNAVHYLKKEDAYSYEIMRAIRCKSKVSENKHYKLPNDEYYLKSSEEMFELFKDIPEAISNSVKIAERSDFEFELGINNYPEWSLDLTPDYTDRKELLRDLCLEKVPVLYGFDPNKSEFTKEEQVVMDRINHELDIIDKMGYCSYFLIVRDLIYWAHDQKIPVGIGRGSSAGSIIAYLARITDIEPLQFNLLFERFLNPDYKSIPDFDIDFCERRKIEVIEYIYGKYGEKRVSQIATYGTFNAKNIQNAKQLHGLNRNISTHAAGIIIGNQELDNIVPLAKNKNDELQTQFSAVACEGLGLLKMDFLGLRTLTVIQDAIDNIKDSHNIDIDWDEIGVEDKKTYELIARGDTIGVFQLESGGLQELCRNFKVETIEHIIAIFAIYRPDLMQFIPDIIATKKGEKKIENKVAHPMMIPIVKETYGFMIYQEQIMQVVQVLAGFTLSEADILRRAFGKKKVNVLNAQKEKFVKGCFDTNKITEVDADKMWIQIEKFAKSAINKSHRVAYSFITYRTAYLKANYPKEYMTAILSSEVGNAESTNYYMNECEKMGINIACSSGFREC